MARVRWTPTAQRDFSSLLDWLVEERGPEPATRAAVTILEAVGRAAQNPEMFAWVGSVHEILAPLPRTIRRVLTRPHRHAIYYRHTSDLSEIHILAIRGSGQLAPTVDELTRNDQPAP